MYTSLQRKLKVSILSGNLMNSTVPTETKNQTKFKLFLIFDIFRANHTE